MDKYSGKTVDLSEEPDLIGQPLVDHLKTITNKAPQVRLVTSFRLGTGVVSYLETVQDK